MDNNNQAIKLCGKKRVYNEYHILFNPCKKCVAKNSARNYQTNGDKIIATSKFYQENTKYRSKSHKQQIKKLNKECGRIDTSYGNIDCKKLNRYILTSKWRSLTPQIVNSANNSLPKINGLSIFIPVDIYVGKWMVIGQPNFHKEN